MTKEQAERIIEEIRVRKGIPVPTIPTQPPVPPGEPGPTPRPYIPMSVLLVSGTQFSGMGWINTHGDIEMAVERLADAHRTKAPVSLWINIDNVEAITDT